MEIEKEFAALELMISLEFALDLKMEIFTILKLLIITRNGEHMPKFIPTPTIGEILKEEFMEPYNISAYRLAKDIDVPVSRIQDILKGKRKITVDTSLRLAKYFGVSDSFFINIQIELETRELKKQLEDTLNNINTHTFNPA